VPFCRQSFKLLPPNPLSAYQIGMCLFAAKVLNSCRQIHLCAYQIGISHVCRQLLISLPPNLCFFCIANTVYVRTFVYMFTYVHDLHVSVYIHIHIHIYIYICSHTYIQQDTIYDQSACGAAAYTGGSPTVYIFPCVCSIF
jgi:hypothetical protein